MGGVPDGRGAWAIFELLRRLEWVLGPVRTRAVATVLTRAESRSEHGYWKTAHRVSPRLATANPGLPKIPETWTRASPLVSAATAYA